MYIYIISTTIFFTKFIENIEIVLTQNETIKDVALFEKKVCRKLF